MTLPVVHEDEVDGVRVFWVDSGRPTLAAILLFRCGIADETLPSAGWTHLAEHLALHGLDGGGLDVNGSTSLLRTEVQAHGPVDRVVSFLDSVTRWFAEPTLERVAEEARVLRAEAEYRGQGAPAAAMLQRFGARGPGLSGYSEPGLSRATPARMATHVASRFTAGNAVLVLDGPPPEGLRLHLPEGARLALPSEPDVAETFPAAYATRGGLVVSGPVPRTHAATLLPGVLQDRLRRDLRDTAGGAYAPWATYEATGRGTAIVLGGSDVASSMLRTVSRQTMATLQSLRATGPREGLVEELVEARVRALEDPYQVLGHAVGAAIGFLEEDPHESPADRVEALRALTREDVGALLRPFLDGLLVGVPAEARWDDELRTLRMPTAQPVAGRRHRAEEYPSDRRVLVVADDVVAIESSAGVHAIRAASIAGVLAYPDGGRDVIGVDGWGLSVEPTLWRRGGEAVDGVDALAGVDRILPMPPRPADRVPRPAPAHRLLWRWLRPWLPALGVLVLGLVLAAVAFSGRFYLGLPAGLCVASSVRMWREERSRRT